MDYKRVLRLHFVNHLSGREIAESCGDCSKTTVNEFLKRFRENPELSYPLPADVTNEYMLIDILFDDPLVKLNSAIIDYNHCQWQGLRRHKCPIDNDFVYEAKQSSRA